MDSDAVRREWAERSGAYSPAYYAHLGPNETSDVIRRTLERFLPRDAPVLELGCSSGRHLSHLHDHGFTDLAGVELNPEAFEVMADAYPELADAGTFYRCSIEDLLGDVAADRFAAVVSVETLQHLHPDAAWVLEDLSRVTTDLLVAAENEGREDPERPTPEVTYVDGAFPLYFRDWEAVFTRRGFETIDAAPGQRNTVRTFRTTSAAAGRTT